MKEIKKLYYWCVFMITLLFLSIQIYFYLFPTTIEEDNRYFYDKIREKEVKSIVKEIRVDYKNRRALYVIYREDSLPIYYSWKEEISAGDSIIKSKGALKLIIKNNVGVKDTLDYGENESIILTDDF